MKIIVERQKHNGDFITLTMLEDNGKTSTLQVQEVLVMVADMERLEVPLSPWEIGRQHNILKSLKSTIGAVLATEV